MAKILLVEDDLELSERLVPRSPNAKFYWGKSQALGELIL